MFLFVDHIGNTLKRFGVYLFGKGLMTAAVMGAGVLSAVTGVSWVLPVVAIGGVVLTAANQFYSMRLQKDEMLELYRSEIGKQLGIDPREVTRAHLVAAAEHNEVIEQALGRMHKRMALSITTAALSSVVTVLLVQAFEIHEAIQKMAKDYLADTIFEIGARFVGVGTVAGLSGMVFDHGLQELLRVNTGFGKASAHDRIMEMQATLNHGYGVTKEQVYGVLVASDRGLQDAILHQFGKRWRHMKPRERQAVVEAVGSSQDMQLLADQINRGEITPGRLAFLMHEADEMLKDPLRMRPQDALAAGLATRLQVRAEEVPAPLASVSAQAPGDAEQTGREVANENELQSHVERLGRSAWQPGSFREQIEAARNQQPKVMQV